jgi:hypothetical protein
MVIRAGPIRNPLGIRGQICCVLWKSMGYRGASKKLQLYPTTMTYSTLVMGWKGLGDMAGDGFVEL